MKRIPAICPPLEPFEILPLLQLGRAAMSSPDRSPDALTHEGMVMLMDIIEDRLFPKQQTPPDDKEAKP